MIAHNLFFFLTGILFHLRKYNTCIIDDLKSLASKYFCDIGQEGINMIEIIINISDVDYEAAAEKIIPLTLDKLSKREDASFLITALSKFKGATGKAAMAALTVLPQNVKDEIATALIQSKKDTIVDFINKLAQERGMPVTVNELSVTLLQED